jgi:membrane-bound hydrogenase subunit beta
MEREEGIRQSLISNFAFLDGKIIIPRERRIFLETPQEEFLNVIRFVNDNLKFNQMLTITGLDLGEVLQFVYHAAHDDGIVMNLKLNVDRENPVIQTITDIYPNSILYERELEDLLGAKVEGLPPGERYPLPEDWPEGQYPLRKDWTPDQLEESKEG